jgi:alpha-beta hydrolase superfamily lysophospholipase
MPLPVSGERRCMLSREREFWFPSWDGVSRVHGILWEPEGTPRAVIQISHGMIEHIGRYGDFAEAMNRIGIAVAGHDHPGHGKTARPGHLGEFAAEQGAECVLADLHRSAVVLKRRYPGIPHILLGHSMGSFFGRIYLTRFGHELDGAIFMGTGCQSTLVLHAGMALVRLAVRLEGRSGRSTGLHRLVLGNFNRRFERRVTEHQWLSRCTEENRKYEADPYCQFLFTNGAFEDFFRVMIQLNRKKDFQNIPKALPILFLSGSEDPVGGRGRGVRKVCRIFLQQGCRDVTMKLYPGARHELLNEQNRAEVFEDIAEWIHSRKLCTR